MLGIQGGYRLLVPQAPAGGAGDASLGDNNDDDDDDDVELLSIDMVEPDNVYD